MENFAAARRWLVGRLDGQEPLPCIRRGAPALCEIVDLDDTINFPKIKRNERGVWRSL
jgi:hypothetical protein